MISTTSYFSISVPLIRENLRRFWVIPVFGFLAYFFTGVFPLLMAGEDSYSIRSYLQTTLDLRNPGFLIYACLFPLIASAMLFRYLHAPGSVSVMHALPFTRRSLFNSHYLSGLILAGLPVLATGVLFLCIGAPPLPPEAVADSASGYPWELFSPLHMLHWLGMSLLLVIFLYTLCVLSAIVTGNMPMHLICSALLNALLPALFFIGAAYCDRQLFGFPTLGLALSGIVNLSPLISFPVSAGQPGAPAVVAYILVILVLYAVTMLLYTKKPLERAGDSLSFRFMDVIVCYFIALLGMTALAFYFEDAMGGGTVSFYIGLAVGTLIAFFLARIIIKRTVRVWGRETWIQLGAYALAVALFLTGLQFDLFGYERRIPVAERVQSFSINPNMLSLSNGKIVYDYWSSAGYAGFQDPVNLRAIMAFHQRITENKASLRGADNDGDIRTNELQLRYTLSGVIGTSMNREWTLPWSFTRGDESLKTLVESAEFKELNRILTPEYPEPESVKFSQYGVMLDVNLSLAERRAFLACVEKDMRLETYAQFTDLANPLLMLDITLVDKLAGRADPRNRYVSVSVPRHYANSVAWLQENGYYEQILQQDESISSVTLVHYVYGEDPYNPYIASSTERYSFDDPALVRAALAQGESTFLNYRDRWELQFTVPGLSDSRGDSYYGADEDGSYFNYALYLNEGNPLLAQLEGNPLLERLPDSQ
ncbi:MAG: hypothetical protein LBT26_05925 [Clostridiales Family XIII bacterium]|jgi:ABC-2 type transport system permease protein|nr:hypothetical protein [Clostridiales Family XIII bacterium]